MEKGKGEGVVSLVEGEGEQGRVGVGIHRYYCWEAKVTG